MMHHGAHNFEKPTLSIPVVNLITGQNSSNMSDTTEEVMKESSTFDDQKFPYRIDWYQTDTDVVITVFRKKENQNEKYDVAFSENTLRVTATTEDGGYGKVMCLEKTIDPGQSSWAVLPSKIEIKLRKSESIKWTSYEAKKPVKGEVKPKNWDEFVNKIEDEKLEGEALLNKFFGDIYEKGSDEVKRAMIKSFYESGGTELNTDWENVSSRRVEIKPPEGMEWKPWSAL